MMKRKELPISTYFLPRNVPRGIASIPSTSISSSSLSSSSAPSPFSVGFSESSFIVNRTNIHRSLPVMDSTMETIPDDNVMTEIVNSGVSSSSPPTSSSSSREENVRTGMEYDDDNCRIRINSHNHTNNNHDNNNNAPNTIKGTNPRKKRRRREMSVSRYRTSRNVAHWLVKQAVSGRRFPRILPSHWTVASWIQLGMNGSRTGGSTPFPALTNTVTSLTGLPRKATIMAFDSLGVLLAVAYHDGKLCIYDMDELSFLYLRTKQQQHQLQQQQQKEKQNGQVEEGDNTEQGKQEQQELEPQTNSTTTSTTPATLPPTTTILKPVLEVCLPFRYISFLQWNPFQQDILAVGNRASGTVHMYDVSVVAAWQQRCRKGIVQHGSGEPPCRVLHCGVKSPSEFALLFVEKGEHALVSINDQLSCWNITNQGNCLWKFSWGKPISHIAIVSKNLVLLGSSRGMMGLLDYGIMQRTAFSHAPTPTLRNEWYTIPRGMKNTQQSMFEYSTTAAAASSWMGIREMMVDGLAPDGMIQVRWISFGGWLLSGIFPTTSNHPGRIHVQYETERIQNQTIQGQIVTAPQKNWSLPVNGKVQTTANQSVLVWEHVPAVTRILPGHDIRVAGADRSYTVRANDPPTLLYQHVDDSRIGRIPLPQMNGSPSCFVLHPSYEWLVVGTVSNHLYVLHS